MQLDENANDGGSGGNGEDVAHYTIAYALVGPASTTAPQASDPSSSTTETMLRCAIAVIRGGTAESEADDACDGAAHARRLLEATLRECECERERERALALVELFKRANEAPRERAAIERIQEDLREARTHIVDSIVALHERGTRLETLLERSDTVAETTQTLYRNATRLAFPARARDCLSECCLLSCPAPFGPLFSAAASLACAAPPCHYALNMLSAGNEAARGALESALARLETTRLRIACTYTRARNSLIDIFSEPERSVSVTTER